MAKNTPSSWQIETLFRRAYDRTKQRFLSYVFVYLIGIAIFLAAGVGLLLVGGILFLLFRTVNLPALIILLGAMFGLGFIGVLIYLGSWIQLTVLNVMTEDKKTTVNESLKKVRPLVPGFIVLNVLSGLFIFGLLPFGLLSLFILFILWGLWGSLAGFVYLYQKQPLGLKSLWISRQMVNQNFWGIAGRLLLVFMAFYLITFLFGFSRNSFLSALTPIISLIFTPFLISFIYEIYKNLTVPKSVTTPKVWVTLSVVGWVITLVFFVSVGTFLTSLFGQMIKNNKRTPYQNDSQYSPPRINTR